MNKIFFKKWIIVGLLCLIVGANGIPIIEGFNEDIHSDNVDHYERIKTTTGPTPIKIKEYDPDNLRNTTVISGVPAYIWYNGCTPTAVGMIIGYYDTHGSVLFYRSDFAQQTPFFGYVV